MTYKWSKQENGLWTLHDYAVFAATERKGHKFDEAWIKSEVARLNEEERLGFRPLVHRPHSKKGEHSADPHIAKAARARAALVPSNGKKSQPGIVTDWIDITDEDREAFNAGRFPNRSIEAWPTPDGRFEIRSIAAQVMVPDRRLRQASEPAIEEFAAPETPLTLDYTPEVFMDAMPSLEGGPLAQIMQQLSALATMLPAFGAKIDAMAAMMPLAAQPPAALPAEPPPGAPAADEEPAEDDPPMENEAEGESAPPDAQAPPEQGQKAPSEAGGNMPPSKQAPPANMEAEVSQELVLFAENQRLKGELAAAKQTPPVDQAAVLFSELERDGYVFDRDASETMVKKHGIELFKELVVPQLVRASIDPAVAPSKPAKPAAPAASDDLVAKFSAEWDEAAATGIELTSFGKDFYIEQQVKRAKSAALNKE